LRHPATKALARGALPGYGFESSKIQPRSPEENGDVEQRHYRHVIDRLVRKPGAFENYRYKDGFASDQTGEMPYAGPQEGLSIGGCSSLGLPSQVSQAAPDDPFHRSPIKPNPPAPTENTQPPQSFHAPLPKGHDHGASPFAGRSLSMSIPLIEQ